MKVLKFGGSSQGNIKRIEAVLTIIQDASQSSEVAVVVSAFQGVTDQLIMMAQLAQTGDSAWEEQFKAVHDRHIKSIRQLIAPKSQTPVISQIKCMLNELEDALRGIRLIRECSLRSLDFVMSFGERLSATIVANTLASRGTDAHYLDARNVVFTDAQHGNAKVDLEKTREAIQAHLKRAQGIAVMTGFIAQSPDGSTTTIGRSGSDYSASILGACAEAESIEIWTDVDGVMSADPRRVKDAFVIEKMSYEEAMELSHFGAKVIHPHTMTPAVEAQIPLIIKNTFNPDAPGTVIGKDPAEGTVVVGISSIDNVSLLNVEGNGMTGIPGIAERLFGALADKNISVILIAQASSEHSICIAVNEAEEADAVQAIHSEFQLERQVGHVEDVQVIKDVSVLAAVGSNMSGRTGTAGTLFRALGENDLNVIAIAQGLSELNISFIVKRQDAETALNVIHQAFFLSDQKQVHLYCVGMGTIGGELLKQIDEQRDELCEQLGINLNVAGIANSRRMVFAEESHTAQELLDRLDNEGDPMDLNQFVERMTKEKRARSIFIDNTASEAVTVVYPDVIKAHIPIVTPNKKFNSKSFEEYQALRELSRVNNTGFYYETNVGAGLPIIETMKDLKNSGDKILEIEGILSGTLSYIFNSFDGEKSFSDIVKMAQDQGYTEPDPREDLSGMDVARKLLILGREMGLTLELEDIEVENLVPESCRSGGSVDEFYEKLAAEDGHFAERLGAAQQDKAVLRYVGKIENGKASVALEKVPADHPFASLKGSDNIVSLKTRRYSQTPLVVQGPGAGPGVTAAGVFADILRAAYHYA